MFSFSSADPCFALDGYRGRLRDNNPRDYAEEKPATANRHTLYLQPQTPETALGALAGDQAAAAAARNAAAASGRLNVRLRARQVLCHRCKNVCNERGESVSRRGSEKASGGRSAAETAALKHLALNQSLFPWLKKLSDKELEKYRPRQPSPPTEKEDNSLKIRLLKPLDPDPIPGKTTDKGNSPVPAPLPSSVSEKENSSLLQRRSLRKKRSALGSMEDLWDESALEEDRSSSKQQRRASASTLLKISVGGKRTVMRMAHKTEDTTAAKSPARRAAEKVLRRAKASPSGSPWRLAPSPLRGINSPVRISPSESGRDKASSPTYSVVLQSAQPNKIVIKRPKRKKRRERRDRDCDGSDFVED